MFDYNFPEQLTMKRQIILLLSMVIPTDPDILKDIYKKKKELEIEKYHKEDISWRYILRSWRPNDKYRMLFTQINALYPNFIQYYYADYTDDDFRTTKKTDENDLKNKNIITAVVKKANIIKNWTSFLVFKVVIVLM